MAVLLSVACAAAEESYSIARIPGGAYEGDFFEDSAPPFIVLQRAGDLTAASQVTVSFSTRVDANLPSATAGVDFNPGSVVATFAAGESRTRVPVPLINDARVEDSEVIGFSFPESSSPNAAIVNAPLTIMDNDFNLLPASAVCHEWSGAVTGFLPRPGGKILLVTQRLEPPLGYSVFQINADGTIDPNFALPDQPNSRVHDGPGGTIALVSDFGDSGRLRLLNANGTLEEGFTPFEAPYIGGVDFAADGSLFVLVHSAGASRVVKLRRNGTVDTSFGMTFVNAQITSMAATEAGGVLVSAATPFELDGATRQFARLTTAGRLDATFAPTAVVGGLERINGAIYGRSDGQIVRLLQDGAIDPSFSPFPSYGVTQLLADSAGRLISVQGRFNHVFYVNRYLPNGEPDPSYTGGLFYGGAGYYEVALANDDTLFAMGDMSQVNGAALTCGSSEAIMARFDLTPSAFGAQIDPAQTTFREGVATQRLVALRVGDNTSAATVGYRIRNGTATRGADFTATEPGALTFAAGSSRAVIPFAVIDDLEIEPTETLHIDFLNGEGELISTSEVRITSQDIALRILRRVSGNSWEMRAENGGRTAYYEILGSSNFVNWSVVAAAFDERPFQVQFNEAFKFFRLQNRYSDR